MTNSEKYSKDLLKMLSETGSARFGVLSTDSSIFKCNDVPCKKCKFYNDNKGCEQNRADWLKEEYDGGDTIVEVKLYFGLGSSKIDALPCTGYKVSDSIFCSSVDGSYYLHCKKADIKEKSKMLVIHAINDLKCKERQCHHRIDDCYSLLKELTKNEG